MDLSNLIGVWSTAQDTARQLQIAQAQRQLAYAQMVNQMRDQQIQQATNLYKAGMPGSAVEQTFPMTGIQGLPEESPDIGILRAKTIGPMIAAALRGGNVQAGTPVGTLLGPALQYLGADPASIQNLNQYVVNPASVQAAGINAGSRKDVANINAQSRQNVAGANNQVRLGLGVLNAANGAGESAGSYVPNTLGVLGQYASGLMQQNGITPPAPGQQIVPQPNVKTATQASIAAGNNATALDIAGGRNATALQVRQMIDAQQDKTLQQRQNQFSAMMRLRWEDLNDKQKHEAAQIAMQQYGIDSANFRARMSGKGGKLSPYYTQQIAVKKGELNALNQQLLSPMNMAPQAQANLKSQIQAKQQEILDLAQSADQDIQAGRPNPGSPGSGALDPRDYGGTVQGQAAYAPGQLPPLTLPPPPPGYGSPQWGPPPQPYGAQNFGQNLQLIPGPAISPGGPRPYQAVPNAAPRHSGLDLSAKRRK